MRLIFAGTPAPALVALDAILSSRHQVVAVLSKPDAPAGRGRRAAASPVSARARDLGIELLTPSSPSDSDVVARIAELAPDCAPIVAYGGLITAPLLAIPTFGWINLHFSLLPRWRGAAPVQHAIWAGDVDSGATTFVLEEGLDTGPIVSQVREEIRSDDTTGDLLARLSVRGAELLVTTLDALEEGTIQAIAQPSAGVTLASKITVDQARVNWAIDAIAIDRQIRACTPHPGAWTTCAGARVKVFPVVVAAVQPDMADLPPGHVFVSEKRVVVGTATRAVILGDVQPHGKKPMPATDWYRGLRENDVIFT